MPNFQGFVFQDPKESKNEVSALVIDNQEEDELDANNRLQTYQDLRAPFDSRSEIQENRRLQALELQKRQRNDIVASLRQLELFSNEGGEEQSTLKRSRDDSDEEMEQNVKLSKQERPGHKKKPPKKNIYADQIMYAENLESIPSDFAEEWMSIICPKGKRCLVTSGHGQTVARSRGGKIIQRFQSILPNGSRDYPGSDYSILDCVYDAVHWTFYIIDVMCWRGYSVTDCDTTFRNFWLHTKFESNDFNTANSENRYYKFTPLKFTPTSEVSVIASNPERYLNEIQQNTYEIDGLLFYHKQAHYVGG
ncbi:hypothetical protein CU098_005729, partial [Rhizopus stolonifer]